MRIWGISVNTFFCHSFVLRKGERLGLWRNWRGGQGVTDEGGKGFPWKAKCKNWAPFTLYFDITTLLVFSRLIFASLVLFSDNFGFQYRQPYADSLSLLHFFFLLRWSVVPVQLIFCPLAQTSISATGWGIRWKRSGLVHCARSEIVWSKWLSHCQVFWAAEEVDERISTLQAYSVLFDFLSSSLQNELSRQIVKS